jgi:hypothetical protein
MPPYQPEHDPLLSPMTRIPILRAALARRTWPALAGCSQDVLDRCLDEMALRAYRAEARGIADS